MEQGKRKQITWTNEGVSKRLKKGIHFYLFFNK